MHLNVSVYLDTNPRVWAVSMWTNVLPILIHVLNGLNVLIHLVVTNVHVNQASKGGLSKYVLSACQGSPLKTTSQVSQQYFVKISMSAI